MTLAKVLAVLSKSIPSIESMARPKVSEAEKRSLKFSFRLTEAEHRKLIKLAELCGCVPGDLIRTRIFKGKFPESKSPRIDQNTYFELKKIGNNLNQLTKLLHMGKMHPSFSNILNQLKEHEENIIKKLVYDS